MNGTHIIFRRLEANEKGITQFWGVFSKPPFGPPLGRIVWFGRWRKYAFHVEPDTVYEETCMRELAEFCEELTKAHRAKRKEEKSLETT